MEIENLLCKIVQPNESNCELKGSSGGDTNNIRIVFDNIDLMH